jgi:hypothetical protein
VKLDLRMVLSNSGSSPYLTITDTKVTGFSAGRAIQTSTPK